MQVFFCERGGDRYVIRIIVGVTDEIQFKNERVLLNSSSTEYSSVGRDVLSEGHGCPMILRELLRDGAGDCVTDKENQSMNILEESIE